MNNKKLTLCLTLFMVLTFSVITLAANYNEAPELEALVESGELESLEERLPENPLVLEPLSEIGEYGGTWQRITVYDEWQGLRMSMYGFSYLRWEDDGLEIKPNLVEDWEANEDMTEWTLHFREGIRWSDGEPLTVDDVLYWWEDLVKNQDSTVTAPSWSIAGGEQMEVEKIDDFTITLKYIEPVVTLPEQLATWPDSGTAPIPMVIAPKHYLSQFHPDYSDEYDDFEVHEEKEEWFTNPEAPVLSEWVPVRYEPGELLVLERNPYYYAVDPEGNQLPYIDGIRVERVSESEIMGLRMMQGGSDFQIRPGLSLSDVSLLRQNEEDYNFETLMYDSGSGTGTALLFNHNHYEDEKHDLFRDRDFKRAVSHAINRDRISNMVHYSQGELSTGTLSPKSPYFHTEEGEVLYDRWKNLANEYNPEKAAGLLDEIGIVDQNDDGWRDLPSGEPLEIEILQNVNAGQTETDTLEIIEENWADIGIKAEINPVSAANHTTIVEEARFDLWVYGISEGDPLLHPGGVVPHETSNYAPLYGAWNARIGTGVLTEELDKDPRDRTPPRQEPDPDSPYAELYNLYSEAMVTTDEDERYELMYDLIDIHIEEGPFFIGTVSNLPTIGVVSDRMKNVPRHEDLALGGYVAPWIMSYSAILNPATFYIDPAHQ